MNVVVKLSVIRWSCENNTPVVMRVHHIGVVEVRLDLVSFSQFGHVVGDREF
jgi:hypothetical protein